MQFLQCLLAVALLLVAGPVGAAEQVIFPSYGALYGTPPQGLTAGPGSSFYGSAANGGTRNCYPDTYCGLIYKLIPPSGTSAAWKSSILYRFANVPDGSSPDGPLTIGLDGSLYGVTSFGGNGCFSLYPQSCGTVFRLDPPSAGHSAWTKTTIFVFTGASTGFIPVGGVLIDRQGALYGAATRGGNCLDNGSNGCGLIYKLTPPTADSAAWTESILHVFTDGIDGRFPTGYLVFDDIGTLYGTTSGQGSSYPDMPHFSTIFALVPNAQATAYRERILYRIRTTLATIASPLVVDRPGGTIYGTTYQGADSRDCLPVATYGCGTVFKSTFAPTGAGTLTVLHSYNNALADGDRPIAGVAFVQGVLYGTTSSGGRSVNVDSCCGTVFALKPPANGGSAWVNVTLHAFTDTPDGNYPSSPLSVVGNSLYGTTQGGGASGNGSAFRVDP